MPPAWYILVRKLIHGDEHWREGRPLKIEAPDSLTVYMRIIYCDTTPSKPEPNPIGPIFQSKLNKSIPPKPYSHNSPYDRIISWHQSKPRPCTYIKKKEKKRTKTKATSQQIAHACAKTRNHQKKGRSINAFMCTFCRTHVVNKNKNKKKSAWIHEFFQPVSVIQLLWHDKRIQFSRSSLKDTV